MKNKIISIISIAIIVCSLFVVAVSCKNISEPVTTYNIWLDVSDDTTVVCSQKVDVVNNYGAPIEELKFNIYANAFDKQKPLPCTQEATFIPKA